jgi:transposase
VLKQQNMPTLSAKISQTEIDKLSYERFAYPAVMIQKRLHAVYLKVVLGYTNQTIAPICGLHYNIVGYWIKVYHKKGYEGLLKNDYGTNTSEMENHGESIFSSFRERPPYNAADAAERIYEMTGIRRSSQQVRTFMKKHGLRFIKCGHIPAKADTEVQQKWVEDTLKPVIEAACQKKVHLFFCDAAHFVLQPFLCYLWTAVRLFIRASAGRNRINVLGAVNAITKEIITLTNTTYITSMTLIDFLKQLKERFPDKPISIVLDNARYQHCAAVKTFAAELGIQLLFLPPYSPNLNIIERLWKLTKKKILYAKYYDKPDAFHSAIRNFFDNINQTYKHDLKSLLSLKFQFFDKHI